MPWEGEAKQWTCGETGVANLGKVGSLVRGMSEPCLSQSPIKVFINVSKMLKPDKWQAAFDVDGRVCGFDKALKYIVLGGIDPSIRADVWEFLLGCYTLGSTAEYRRKLRLARRERYDELLKQCQTMHSSVGTGSLAYVVGSKVMDMRKSCRHEMGKDAANEGGQTSGLNNGVTKNLNNGIDTPHSHTRRSSSESVDLTSGRQTPDSATYESPSFLRASSFYNFASPEPYIADGYFDFPPLPVTDLFGRSSIGEKEFATHGDEASPRHKLRIKDENLHSFRIKNNADIIIEQLESTSNNGSSINSESPAFPGQSLHSNHKVEIVNELRKSDVAEIPLGNKTSSLGGPVSEDRVSEWLWTLHRIVVDVVRTDSHLEFYEDQTNLGRMSDILAVYAWVDPTTGYCQGMSDLLSPFVVLFEDNADAFWCFEMLIRRTRSNFQVEGPTGVMKQLESLWHILQLTDKEMFTHLSRIGAESLHFAFRMLFVLFRRELSFSESLRMWEMMWAADFDESIAFNLENSCLEPLVIQVSTDPLTEVSDENAEDGNDYKSKSGPLSKTDQFSNSGPLPKSCPLYKSAPLTYDAEIKPATTRRFCGLTKSFWGRSGRMHVSAGGSSTRKGEEELPVFCAAAVLVMNRHKIMKESRSIDDMIKIFNDNLLVIRVRRCIRTAINLRKKYVHKLSKSKSQNHSQSQDQSQSQAHIGKQESQ